MPIHKFEQLCKCLAMDFCLPSGYWSTRLGRSILSGRTAERTICYWCKSHRAKYVQLLHNKKYLVMVVLFSFIVLPHFSFTGSAADIYINTFGTSEQVFGYFLAFNALAIMSGSYAFTRLHKIIESRRLLTISFAGILCSGMLMYSGIFPGPWGLAVPMAVASFSFGLSRPPGNNLILEQVEQGAGTASSFMIFIYFMIGAFSMWFIALEWTDNNGSDFYARSIQRRYCFDYLAPYCQKGHRWPAEYH